MKLPFWTGLPRLDEVQLQGPERDENFHEWEGTAAELGAVVRDDHVGPWQTDLRLLERSRTHARSLAVGSGIECAHMNRRYTRD